MKKSRQTKRSSKRATKDLEVPAAGRKHTKDVKGGDAGKVAVHDISITKVVDKSSPLTL